MLNPKLNFLKISLTIALSGLFMLPAYAGEVTLSGASCFPIGSPPGRDFEKMVDELNQRGKGVVQIDLKGGALRSGVLLPLPRKWLKAPMT